jgi:hypothetical protein
MSVERAGVVKYPGLFICPSLDAVFRAARDSQISASMVSPMYFSPRRPYEPEQTKLPDYNICPRTVTFKVPGTDNKTVTCLDFQQNPERNAAYKEDTCPETNAKTFWFQDDDTTPAPPQYYAAFATENQLEMALKVTYDPVEPLVAMLYSTSTQRQPPKTFEEFRDEFALIDFERATLPVSGQLALSFTKRITDDFPDSRDCSVERFSSETRVYAFFDPPKPPDPTRYVSVIMGYSDLLVEKICHVPVKGLTDVFGIIGGGIGLTVAITLLLSAFVQHLTGLRGGAGDGRSVNAGPDFTQLPSHA